MEGSENFEDEFLDQIDWESLFDDIPEDTNLLGRDNSPASDGFVEFPNRSPDFVDSWIVDVEQFLMTDDDHDSTESDVNHEFIDDFLSHIIVGSSSDDFGEFSDDKDSNVSDENQKKRSASEVKNDEEDGDDPVTKKRKRQLRNRDAALRSRERKKMYVKDLEMKSRYLEGECRRLGRLLQCCFAENQALRLSLQNQPPFGCGASVAKQESAVLLLESLLLGSLLWFLGIMCLLFNLHPLLPPVLLESLGKKGLENVGPRGAGNRVFQRFSVLSSFIKTKRCKASRRKMKHKFSSFGARECHPLLFRLLPNIFVRITSCLLLMDCYL